MRKKIYVINLKGEKEPFSFRKVFLSARKMLLYQGLRG